MVIAALGVCLPVGGASIQPAFSFPQLYTLQARAAWWISPFQLALLCACLVVLCLLTVHER